MTVAPNLAPHCRYTQQRSTLTTLTSELINRLQALLPNSAVQLHDYVDQLLLSDKVSVEDLLPYQPGDRPREVETYKCEGEPLVGGGG